MSQNIVDSILMNIININGFAGGKMGKNGFTLVELIVAAAILSIVSLIAYQTLSNVYKAHDAQYVDQQLTLNTTKTLDIIKRVMRKAEAGIVPVISGASTGQSITITAIKDDGTGTEDIGFNYTSTEGGLIYVTSATSSSIYDTIAENVSSIRYTYTTSSGILLMELTIYLRDKSRTVRDVAITRIHSN